MLAEMGGLLRFRCFSVVTLGLFHLRWSSGKEGAVGVGRPNHAKAIPVSVTAPPRFPKPCND